MKCWVQTFFCENSISAKIKAKYRKKQIFFVISLKKKRIYFRNNRHINTLVSALILSPPTVHIFNTFLYSRIYTGGGTWPHGIMGPVWPQGRCGHYVRSWPPTQRGGVTGYKNPYKGREKYNRGKTVCQSLSAAASLKIKGTWRSNTRTCRINRYWFLSCPLSMKGRWWDHGDWWAVW